MFGFLIGTACLIGLTVMASVNSLQDAYGLSLPLSAEAKAVLDQANRRLRARAPNTISSR